MTLDINSVRYNLDIHQKNNALPYLVMLHGFMGDSRSFEHLLDGLAHVCNPVTFDLLGHGKTETLYDDDRYREERQIEDLKAIIRNSLQDPPFLYGYSMGGRLALKTASAAPELFKGVILESTNPGIEDGNKRKERKAVDLERALEIEQDFEGFLRGWEKLPLFHSNREIPPGLAKQYQQMHLDQDPKTMAASLRGFGTGSIKPVTANHQQFEGPVLLLAGSEDQKYVNSNKKMQNLFKQVSNHTILAGHRVHLDNPEKFIEHVTSFIKQHTQPI